MSIQLLKFGKNNADYLTPKNILVVGVVHGDEPMGEYVINEYLNSDTRELKNNLYYIPRLNRSNTRKNPNGVDLNRNFPTKNWKLGEKDEYFGGNFPSSETETKFITGLMDSVNFDAAITIHAPYKVINYDGINNPSTLILAKRISEIFNYPMEADIGYPTPGSFGTYSGVERNIPTITIECDENEALPLLYLKFKKLFEYLEQEY